MKSLITLLFVCSFGFLNAQNILFVNDNDNILENTDSMIVALQSSGYNFDIFSIPDSGFVPDIGVLESYDLTIWYASTDGVGLGLWTDGNTGESNLTSHLAGGGDVWLIGSDILFAGGYGAPNTFTAGSFAYEYMGIDSYNVQSYGDDGNTGLPQVDLLTGVPTAFPDSLTWIFSTFWWADGVTPRTGSIDIYEMGPSSYALAGEITMTHYFSPTTNVLSTFFDPALIATPAERDEFVLSSINYMLNFASVDEKELSTLVVYPNPVNTELIIELDKTSDYQIYSLEGKLQTNGTAEMNGSIDVSAIENGIYLLQIGERTVRFVKN